MGNSTKCTHPHFCYEFDGAFITPLMPCFELCTCVCMVQKEHQNLSFVGLERHEQKELKKWKDSLTARGIKR